MTDPFTTVSRISLSGVLPLAFDNDAGRQRFASSAVMLRDVGFERGSVYCLNASSGTGKTSLCGFIYGSRRDYAGDILFDGVSARSLSVGAWCALRRCHIAYLPQELDIFGELSAIDNIRLKNRLTGFMTDSRIRDMMDRLEIGSLADRPARFISVGQRQRVAIVRALCQPFDFILLDEPVSHLDSYNNSLCGALILEEARARGAGIIFTSVGNPLTLDAPVIPMQL